MRTLVKTFSMGAGIGVFTTAVFVWGYSLGQKNPSVEITEEEIQKAARKRIRDSATRLQQELFDQRKTNAQFNSVVTDF